MFYPEIRLSVHHGVLVPNVSSLCSRLPMLPSIFLPISFPRSHIIKVLWYIITVHIYLKSPLGEYAASPPLLSLRIIKCYYLHPASSFSASHSLHPQLWIKKTSLTTSEANWKQKKKNDVSMKMFNFEYLTRLSSCFGKFKCQKTFFSLGFFFRIVNQKSSSTSCF